MKLKRGVERNAAPEFRRLGSTSRLTIVEQRSNAVPVVDSDNTDAMNNIQPLREVRLDIWASKAAAMVTIFIRSYLVSLKNASC